MAANISQGVARGQDDPSVKIPDAVKRAAARADNIHKQAYTPPANPPASEATPEPQPNPPVVPKEPPPSQEPPAPQPSPTASSEAPPVTSESNQVAPSEWEHRYNSMKGRHDALANEMRQMRTHVQNLTTTLATVQSNKSNGSTLPAPELTEVTVTPEEEREYGSEFLAVVAKKAQQAMMPYVKQLEQKVAELQGKVTTVDTSIHDNGRQRMFEALDRDVPNWGVINNDEKFLSWLTLPDAYSGAIRKQMLTAAFERNDAPRVVAFFQGFLKDEAATAPRDTAPNPPAVINPPPGPKVSLEELAAPGRAKNTAATPPVEKPIISPVQISAFYAALNSGKYRGREAEANALEAEIFAATREGRVR